jgi:hypothetical protein
MSIYSKPLSQISTADLQELLAEGAVENARLEFKLLPPDKDDTLKKVSSFANTFGGWMIIGARALSSDGRIQDLPGIDEVSGYKQRVVDWCFVGASPPLTIEVSDPVQAPSGSGKVCYVIRVPESDVAPHFLNGRKGVWVRTDEFSARFEERLANENELKHLLERRKLILQRKDTLLERARRRFQTYGNTIRAQSGSDATSNTRLELCVVPRFPSRPVCEQEQLTQLVPNTRLPWRSIFFPRHPSNIVTQHESTILLEVTEQLSMLEANIWGMLFYATKIDENERGTRSIHLYQFVGFVLLFVRHAAKVFGALGLTGPVEIHTTLASIRSVRWAYRVGNQSAYHDGSPFDDEVAFLITTDTEALRTKPEEVAVELLRYLFLSVNWADIVDTTEKLQNLVRLGRGYNGWTPTTTL